jgi:hypothetical protein
MFGRKKEQPPKPKFDRDRHLRGSKYQMWTLAVTELLAGKRNFAAVEASEETGDPGQQLVDACYRIGLELGYTETEIDANLHNILNNALKNLANTAGLRENVGQTLLPMYQAAHKRGQIKK